jgi:hypothetical protein
MKVQFTIHDSELEHPQLGTVPVVNVQLESLEEVVDKSEPTPAMWTAAAIFDLHKSGRLMEITKAFIATGKTEAVTVASD